METVQAIAVGSDQAAADALASAQVEGKNIALILKDGSMVVFNHATHVVTFCANKVQVAYKASVEFIKSNGGQQLVKVFKEFIDWVLKCLNDFRLWLNKKSEEIKAKAAKK